MNSTKSLNLSEFEFINNISVGSRYSTRNNSEPTFVEEESATWPPYAHTGGGGAERFSAERYLVMIPNNL